MSTTKSKKHGLIFLLVCLLLVIVSVAMGILFHYYPFAKYPVLYQLSNTTNSQMMGYLLKTGDGKVIAIDGGTRGDASQMCDLIEKIGGVAWRLGL